MRMFILIAIVFLAGCSASLPIPTAEESRAAIAAAKPKVDSLDNFINARSRSIPYGTDLITNTRTSAVNLLLEKVTNRTTKDIRIDFLATRPLWKEERSVLGLTMTNQVNIDTGSFDIDIKRFTFTSINRNTITAQIEFDGGGNIAASGTAAGVSARVQPQVQFYLNEQVFFTVSAADSDYIKLSPVPKTMKLKIKITIDLLGWSVPYYKEIPLLTTDLVKPILIPSAVQQEIVFPLPSATYGGERLQFVKRKLRFLHSSVLGNNNTLEYRSNIDFERP